MTPLLCLKQPIESMFRPLINFRERHSEDGKPVEIFLVMVANPKVHVIATSTYKPVQSLSQYSSSVSLPMEEWTAAALLYHEKQAGRGLDRALPWEGFKVFRFNTTSSQVHSQALFVGNCSKVSTDFL